MDCVGCGFCCIKSACMYEIMLHGNKTQCPELIWDKKKKRYFCNLVLKKEINVKFLFIGEGCCCGLNSWRQNVQPQRNIDK